MQPGEKSFLCHENMLANHNVLNKFERDVFSPFYVYHPQGNVFGFVMSIISLFATNGESATGVFFE